MEQQIEDAMETEVEGSGLVFKEGLYWGEIGIMEKHMETTIGFRV